MQRETSNDSFLDYGSVYHQPIDREHPEDVYKRQASTRQQWHGTGQTATH